MGPSIYQTSPRMAFPQIPSGYDPYSRTPMGSSAMSTPSVPENPPAPIAMMFSPPPVPQNPPAPIAMMFPPPPVPQNPPAPVAARYPPPIPASVPSSRSNPPPIPAPPIPASVPSSRSNPPPIPAPPIPASVPSSRSNPPPIPAPPIPANPRAGSVGNSPSQVSVNTPSSDRIYGYNPVDSSNSGCANLSTSIFPNLPNVPTSVPSSFIPSPLEMPELPTVPSSTPNREEVASPEAIQLEPESM